jgi:predicted dehydrogenase
MKRPLRGAIIGYGFISSQGHAPTYAKHMGNGRAVEITAIADICEARRQAARQMFPSARIYANHASLLAAQGAELDFVDITTPPVHHAEIAHAALTRGLHVLCEKPMATSSADARAMLRHGAEARRVVFPCHNYKHAPVIKLVRSILDEDAIGPVHLVTMQTFRNTHAKGVSEWRPDWRRERALSGGGIAMDHGSHTFYLAFDWMAAYPTRITAHTSATDGRDTEDVFGCTLTFPTGVVSAHLSWTAGVRKVMYTLHGCKGAIRVEDEDVELAVLEAGPGVVAPGSPGKWRFERRVAPSNWMDASHVGWFSSLFDEFRSAIAREEYVGKDAMEACLCVDLIERAYQSAAEGSRQLEAPSGIAYRPTRARAPWPRQIPGREAEDLV